MSQQVGQGKVVMVEGRIVWTSGDLFKGKVKTIFGTQQPKLNAKGEQQMEYGFGLAVPKSAVQEVWTTMHEEAYTIYPSRQLPPSFAMKFKDGDTGVDDKGTPYNTRTGYAGHIVLACTTTIQPKFFRNENGQSIMINDGIRCGDYVRVQLVIKAHAAIGQGKPGLYINPNAVLFLGYGEAIVNTPTGDQIFGTATPVVPPGASAVPVGPAMQMLVPPAGTPAMPTAPHYGVVPPAGTPAMPTAPHYGVVPQQYQPQPLVQHYQQVAPVMPTTANTPTVNGMPPGFPTIPQ